MGLKAPIQIYDFTAGWLSGLEARADLRVYYKGGREVTNTVGLTTGGQKRRGGTRQLAEIPEAANGAVLARFEFSTEQTYLHVFLNETIRVFKDGEFMVDVTAPWVGADLSGLRWTQSLDTMMIAHTAYPTQKLVRQGGHTAWGLSDIAWTNPPTYRFADPTTVTGTPAAKTGSGVTFTAGADAFAAGDVDKWIIGNDGKALITAYTSATQVTISIRQDFKDTTAIAAGEWSIEEDVWTAARGYPGVITLFEERTFIGASQSLLQTTWGSRSGEPFDFKSTYEALDDEAVGANLRGNRVNAIHQLFALDALFLFTTGGVWVQIDRPITPANYLPKKHCAVPAADLQAVELEERVAFISADEEGNPVCLQELQIDEMSTDTRYVPNDLSVLCPDAVADPVDLTARKSRVGGASASHVFVVNGDGSMGVLHSRRRENILGWTRWESRGNSGTDKVMRAAVVGNDIHLLVRRTIAGATRWFLEVVDDDAFWDCSKRLSSETPQSLWGGFAHLEGETVAVWADGARRDDVIVTDGAITVSDGGTAVPVRAVEAGLPFSWAIETMPVEAQLADGTLIGEAHRIVKATIRVKDAYEMTVNGRPVAFRKFRGMTLDTPLQPFSGIKQIRFLGWRPRDEIGATVRLTGQLPITIESATLVVAQ
ncbi:MAG: hypothetical protein IH626_00425 [Rhodospirillales bacterium]|nr:hypothetical protein [Rhodospirillales bacterium]